MQVSVAICTWNRHSLLDSTLNQMESLRVPSGVEWELLVVNNNCSDQTDEVIARYQASGRLPLRRLFELSQGLSNARNRALADARGDLILWTDDDVLVDSRWLEEYWAASLKFPEAAYFGGTVDPWFESSPPAWVLSDLDKLEGAYAIRQLGSETRYLGPSEDVYGANMGFRRDALNGRRFDSKLGRIGKGMLSGEETALCASLRSSGQKGVWIGPARVQHYIPSDRLTRGYVFRYHQGCGEAEQRQHTVKGYERRWLGIPLWLLRQYLASCADASIQWLTQGNGRVSAFCRMAYLHGRIREAWRAR